MNVQIWKDAAAWDAFVEGSPDASNYHRWSWGQAIRDTYGHAPYYLAAVEGGAIQGVLPLVWMKSRLFGRFLVSVPFFSYGGVLARGEEAGEALLQKASELAGDLGANHIELRQGGDIPCGWQGSAAKVTMEISLPSQPEQYWNSLSSGLRNKIRNGRKQGLQACWGGLEAVDDFYPVFAANMRNLGTPVYSKRWFQNLCRHFPKDIRVLVLRDGGRPVAGAFLVPFRDTLELPWSASLPDSRKKYSQVFLYWTFLEWAIQQGYRKMDLGRCNPGSGTHEFKRHWICQERSLHWYYWLAPGRELPNLRPDNPRYRLSIQVWKRLPLFAANSLGPLLVRSLP